MDKQSGQMQVKYEDQSALDLCFNLTQGSIDLNQFSLVKTGEGIVSGSGLRVTAHIIGASHLVQIEVGDDLLLSEIFACTPVVVSKGALMFYIGPLRNFACGQDHVVRGNHLVYGFRAKTVDATDQYAIQQIDEFTAQVEAASQKADSREIGLMFEFPDQEINTSGLTPATLVRVQIKEGPWQVITETMHIYPNEGLIVSSRSYLMPKNGKEDSEL